MSLRRTLAIARKEFRHITRDPRIIFLVTISPALLLLTFSYVFSFDVDQFALAVLDLDKSPLSRQLLSRLTADDDFWVYAHVSSYEEIDALLLQGDVDAALVIPPGFDAAIRRGRPTQVQAIVDGVDSISATYTVSHLGARMSAFSADVRLEAAGLPTALLQKSPESRHLVGGGEPPLQTFRIGAASGPILEVRSRVWYNTTLKSLVSMVPGLMAVMLQMPALAVALALSREKETGSFETLMTTPIRGAEYFVGKLSAYVISGLVSSLLALGVAVFWFHVPFRGSMTTLLLLDSVFFLASMGIGLLVGNLVSSQQTAMTIMMLVVFIPSFFLSGLILPVDRSSLWARLSSLSLPTTHFIRICRSLFLKGAGLAEVWPSAAWLAAMGSGLLGINILLFKKRAS